jgi:RluA family pseudouridine synthase
MLPDPAGWVLWTDEQILVVNKPAGLSTLIEGWKPAAPFLKSLLEAHFGRLWTVHRLDKDTSGVIVFARSAGAHRFLNGQFESRQARKIYHALVSGSPAWERQTAIFPLRANAGRRHLTVVDPRLGKAAETELQVIERFPGAALVEAQPHTGRTHQVRAHLAALGHPLLGDGLYTPAPAGQGKPAQGGHSRRERKLGLIARAALHAFRLELAHPESGELQSWEAPYPPDFAAALSRLRSKYTFRTDVN